MEVEILSSIVLFMVVVITFIVFDRFSKLGKLKKSRQIIALDFGILRTTQTQLCPEQDEDPIFDVTLKDTSRKLFSTGLKRFSGGKALQQHLRNTWFQIHVGR